MIIAGQNERRMPSVGEIIKGIQEERGLVEPSDIKEDAPVTPSKKDSAMGRRPEDRLWEGFQKERRVFLGVSVALTLYLWGDVEVEKLAFLGASFTIQDEWTFKFLILAMWVLLGWRYWTYEKEVAREEFQGEFDSIRQERLRQLLLPQLKRDLEAKARPEIQKGINPPPESGFRPWPKEHYEKSEEIEEFVLQNTNWRKSEFKTRKQVKTMGEDVYLYNKEFLLEIRGYRNLRAHVKSWVYMAMKYRHFSDYKGPYFVAAFALIGLIKHET